MTKKEAKTIALGFIISISDVSFDDDDGMNHLQEKDRDKVYDELQNLLDSMRDRLSNLENKQRAISTRSA